MPHYRSIKGSLPKNHFLVIRISVKIAYKRRIELDSEKNTFKTDQIEIYEFLCVPKNFGQNTDFRRFGFNPSFDQSKIKA